MEKNYNYYCSYMNTIYKVLFELMIITLLFNNCSKSDHQTVDKSKISLTILAYLSSTEEFKWFNSDTVHFDVKQDCYFLPHVDFSILDNGNYLIASSYPSKCIALWNSEGRFINKFGGIGEGPGEYEGPRLCRVYNDTVYCFDVSNQKILRYLTTGQYINEFKIWGPEYSNDFEVLPEKKMFYFYNVFALEKMHIISLYSNSDNNLLEKVSKIGLMDEKNIVSGSFIIRGLELDRDQELLYVIEPQKFGFRVFDISGTEVGSFFNQKERFLKLMHHINKDDAMDQSKRRKLYAKYSRSRFIHDLGEGILGIGVENPKTNPKDEKLPFYYSLWEKTGEYLGSIKSDHRIVKGENGRLYFWLEDLKKDNSGFYGNPSLVIFDFWKEIGYR